MSQFISFLSPTASLATSYDKTKPADDQPARDIPTTFTDAMTVRERVFVEEQGVPLENEFDDDDPRCFHWVVYASVGTSSCGSNGGSPLSSGTPDNSESPPPQDERRQSDPTANRVAVGTIRLVPPPHPPHPAPSDTHKLDNSLRAPPTGSQAKGIPGSEPYIKLGRLAVLPAYRKLGLASLLTRTALDWAAQNSYQILSPPRPEEVELARVEGRDDDIDSWSGLTLVHAQIQLEKYYNRFGFVKDEDMGEFDEEGIVHIGMWLTLKLRE
ncbi:acyl-n-acyltransferase [Diplodia corticola]|uniref:Acyl-n-acyltransferase n=1 Tax=Diplodia corticola TaxID=236234 RepID=A0A1J9QS52_9PEZI|nr:acyl-n-acyltransferase [Diplodia corticola]OJD30818.1 acyl-n-acyltransferase [Diplodia corticola]